MPDLFDDLLPLADGESGPRPGHVLTADAVVSAVNPADPDAAEKARLMAEVLLGGEDDEKADTFAEGGRCKQGERSDLTGCVPAEGGGGGASPVVPVKKEKRVRVQPVHGAAGTKKLNDLLAAHDIPLDVAKLAGPAGVNWEPPWSRKLPETVAQHDPLRGSLMIVDHPGITDKEKAEYAIHELTHALDQKLGPGGFKKATADPDSELGKLARDALADEGFKGGIEKLGYREHQMAEEALAYLASRWARKRLGEPVPDAPAIDALLPRFEAVLLKHGGKDGEENPPA